MPVPPGANIRAVLIFALICLFAGLALGYAGLRLRSAIEAAARWPVTDGTLERCEVVEKPDLDINQPGTWGLGLEYSYRVGGRSYRSTRYGFVEPSTYDESVPRALVEALRAQQPLRVRYDPKDPKSAVLSVQDSDLADTLSLTCFILAGASVLATLLICGLR
jgi:hypothetical protein